MILLAVLILDHLLTRAGSTPIWVSLPALPLAAVLDWRRARNRKVRGLYAAFTLSLGMLLMPWPARPAGEPVVIIDKSRRQLLYQGKNMAIGLGNHPQGTKQEEGDGKTPEGRYRVCSKAADSPFGYWLGLDYPNRSDAWRGRMEGRVSWLEWTAWNWFWRSQPPQSTRLGGQIGIHGGGSRKNWTLGCIALDQANLKELFEQLPLGSVVEIR